MGAQKTWSAWTYKAGDLAALRQNQEQEKFLLV